MDNPAFVIELERRRSVESSTKKHDKIPPQAHTFEEAISLTQIGKFHYYLILIGGLCLMAVMVELMTVSIILPSMKCDLLSTLSQQGLLTSAGFFGVVLSSHAMGFLADTWGRVRTLRYTLILSSIATIISAFSANIWMLIVFRFLNGFFISGGHACVFSLCGEFHGNKTRVRYITLLSVFLPIGLIYLPAIAIVILPLRFHFMLLGINFSSWRLLLLSNSVFTLFALLGLFQLPETPKYLLVQGDHDRALNILRHIYTKNTGRPADEYPVKSIILQTGGASLSDINGVMDALRMIWGQTAPMFYKKRCLHTINICLIMFIVYGISQGAFMWFPTILNEMVAQDGKGLKVCEIIDGMSPGNVQTTDVCAGELDIFMFQVLIMIGGAFTVFYLICSYTIDYIGKRNLLTFWLAVASACVIAIHFISDFSAAVIIITLVMGVSNCGGIVCTISMEFFPTNINAMGMCFIMMVGRLGAVAGSNIIGQYIFGSCDDVFWYIFGIYMLLCGMCAFLPRRKQDHEEQKKDLR